MRQGTYISESTESLIRRAEKVLGGVPVLDLTNPQFPTYTPAGFQTGTQIRSLAGSCHSITVKNTITVVDTSIVVCTAAAPTLINCPVPGSCPAAPLTPNQYVNLYAQVNALVLQNGVDITFKYILNDTPTTHTVTVNLLAGLNDVFAFDPNAQYPVDTTLVLYGAEVTKY